MVCRGVFRFACHPEEQSDEGSENTLVYALRFFTSFRMTGLPVTEYL